ncbi:pilus assembly protein TadG-related protein [Acidithiobacillus sp.]|uniref:pilus assembly protein TadG-related protein n=1 Tax=Acidithiobacillus sp. TaxID=1872118 RepID=UPI003D018DB4
MLFNALPRYDCQTAPEYSESGQAALFATILIPVVLLAGLLVFNTGQLTATKIKTQNAADAAAFSAMQMEARELNFISYTNRAMVANQVAIGQTISLVSWGHYVKNLGQTIQQLGTVANVIPVVGQAIGAIANAIARVTDALDQGVDEASKVVLPLLDGADAALSGAQEMYHLNNGVFPNNGKPGAMTAVAEQMVKLNDPQAQLNTVVLSTMLVSYNLERGNFIKRWGGKKADAQGRMAYMINASRDGFTRERNDMPTMLRPLPSLPLWPFRIGIERRGGGQIATDATGKYAWSGMDTLSFRMWNYRCSLSGCGWRGGLEIPLGWGAAQTAGQEPYHYFRSSRRYQTTSARVETSYPPQSETQSLPPYGSSWDANPAASYIAQSQYAREQDAHGKEVAGTTGDAGRFAAGGITRYQDFVRDSDALKKANGDPADIMPFYLVAVEHPRGTVRDSVTALGIGQQAPARQEMNLVLPQTAQGGQIRAVAKAQAYFRRPMSLWPRADGYYERGNLFSPFWEARLVDLTAQDRVSIATRLGIQ